MVASGARVDVDLLLLLSSRYEALLLYVWDALSTVPPRRRTGSERATTAASAAGSTLSWPEDTS